MKRINKVAILGAGTMGARIAAHFANAGVPSYLLDIVPPDADGPARNKIAAAGLDAAKKSKPAAFMDASLARFVTVGNFEDDLKKLADVDWIIEAVVENLDIKRALLEKSKPSASPAPSSPPTRAACPSAKSPKDSPTTSAGPGSARTSSIRRATCACWKSSPPPKPTAPPSTPSPISATSVSAKASSSPKTRPTSSATASAHSRC